MEGARFEPAAEPGEKHYSVFTIRPRAGSDAREPVFRLARDRGWRLRELTRVPMSLEDIFLEIVGEGAAGGRAQEKRRPEDRR